jgi:hypothetical protein
MSNQILTFLLFRKNLIGLLEGMHHTLLPDAALHEDEEERPITRFAELLNEALRYGLHGRDWHLRGAPIADAAPRILKLVNRDDVSYFDALSYVEGLARSFSWCLIPWGCRGRTDDRIRLFQSKHLRQNNEVFS